MIALLLAAGFGNRLKPLTNTVPKCLVPILEKPLLGYWLELLSNNEKIKKIYINTHYFSDQVEEFIKNHKTEIDVELIYEPKLLGTAGTLKNLINMVSVQDLFVAHADNLSLFNLSDLITSFDQRPKISEITMMTFDTDEPENCGIIKKDKEGIVTEFHEKKKSFHGYEANGAVFIFSKKSIHKIREIENCKDISLDILPLFLGKISVFKNNTYHRDIGNNKSYLIAQNQFPEIYEDWFKRRANR